MYPAELVQPMRDELTAVGFNELFDASAVDTALNKEGTTLLVVNSVCGCAAANARPGVLMSLGNEKIRINSQLFLLGLIVKPLMLLASKWCHFPPLHQALPCLKMESWFICWSDITLRVAPPNSLPKILLRRTTSIAKFPCAKRWLFR